MKRLFCLCVLTAAASMLSAQEHKNLRTGEIFESVETLSAAGTDESGPGQKPSAFGLTDQKKFRITPLAGPGYTPEMGFLLGGGILMSWYPGADPEANKRSSMPLMFTVASVGGYSVSTVLKSFWLNNRLQGGLDFSLRDMNSNYWGRGYENGRNVSKGPDTEYHQLRWNVTPVVHWRLIPNLYAGVLWDLNSLEATDVNARMAVDPDFQSGGPDNLNSGPGLTLMYESRDFPQNARSGLLAEAKLTFYSPAFGSDNRYQHFTLDYRQFQTLRKPGSVLGWQAALKTSWGDTPWSALPEAGSPFDLRGYYQGQYRDETVLWVLGEYRYTFKGSSLLSKTGFVVWGGLGAMGTSSFRLNGLLPNIGAGLRFEVQPRLNVRLDFGWGNDSFGVYFNFQEAF